MSLEERCAHEFDGKVQSRGKEYYQTGRVHVMACAIDFIMADIAGSGQPYEVLIQWELRADGLVKAECTCPYFEDRGLCKHIWATILAADARGLGATIQGSSQLSVIQSDLEDEEVEFGFWDDQNPDSFQRWLEEQEELLGEADHSDAITLRRGGSSQARQRSWREQLSAVGQSVEVPGRERSPVALAGNSREVWFVWDTVGTTASGQFVICLFQRERKLSGEFGKLKRFAINADTVAELPPSAERDLLGLILDSDQEPDDDYGYFRSGYRSRYRYGYQPKSSQFRLSLAAFSYLVPRLCETGRLLWANNADEIDSLEDGRPLRWDDGPPWRFRLRVEPDEKEQQWLLGGEFVRDGEPATVPTMVAGGLMLVDDCVARYECHPARAGGATSGECDRWLAALRQDPPIAIPEHDRWDFLKHLWETGPIPPCDAPAGFQPEPVDIEPRARLVIHDPKQRGPNRFTADVQFLYDELSVPAGDHSAGIVDPERQRIVPRDAAAEQELLTELAARGARPLSGSEAATHTAWIPKKHFASVVDELVEAGWIVEAEGHVIRKAGRYQMSVTSGIDWFDLDGECEFDGATVKLPSLLAALRHGERFVTLDDGSRGLLPREWLQRFAPLAELGEVDHDHIRFQPSQALFLDALLAARDEAVSVDQPFAQLRRKLQTFNGIAPRREPRGFHGELRHYQREGLGWLHFLRDFGFGGCLADDMGLGKTVQVLALLQSRRMRPRDDQGNRAPSLAVVPRSLIFNWLDEAERFTPNLRTLQYTGTGRKHLRDQFGDADLIVTTYGTLRRDITTLKDTHFDYVILDEAQAIKNPQSQNAKACRLINADHRLALTGTPVENHLGELWSLLEFLNPGMLGRSSAFRRLTGDRDQQPDRLPALRQALKPFILRRTKQNVLSELPEKTEQTLCCDLKGKHRRRYNEIRDYYRASLAKKIESSGLAKSKIHVLEALLRLRQAACHPGLLDKDEMDGPSAKLDALMEQLAEVIDEGHKALVFSQFTALLAIVRRRLDRDGIRYEYLDGRTQKRKECVQRFQEDPECPLFLISLKAGGHGLNLTAAEYVFILDPWWNPAVEAQAIDRVHRIGQQRRVFAYRLIARDSVEEKILELQKNKRDLADAIVSADDSLVRNLTVDDLQLLLS